MFVGKAKIFDSEVYIDTRDGTGYDEAVTKLRKLVTWFSSKYYMPDNTDEDNEQDIVELIIKGIASFNPSKAMKLSTFLYMYVEHRLMGKLKYNGAMKRNPTLLNTSSYRIKCKCSDSFISVTINNDESIDNTDCRNCGDKLTSVEAYPINPPPKSYAVFRDSKTGRWRNPNIDAARIDNPYMALVFDEEYGVDEQTIYRHDLNKALDKKEPKARELLKLIIDGRSLSEASRMTEMSRPTAYSKLRKFQKDEVIKDILNK